VQLAGPRKLRLGDASCLVECAPLAGPTPVDIQLLSEAVEVVAPRPAADAVAKLDALNVTYPASWTVTVLDQPNLAWPPCSHAWCDPTTPTFRGGLQESMSTKLPLP